MGGFIQRVETLPSAVASPSSGFPIPHSSNQTQDALLGGGGGGGGEAAADSHLSMAFPLSSCLRGIGQLLGCRTPCLENGSQLVLQPSAPSIPRSWENPQ